MVRAFDVRTGGLSWDWDPAAERADDPDAARRGDGWRTTGAANVWAPIAIDDARGLVFLPTTSPSPDFYGGLRLGDNRRADSVVALEAETDTVVWSYQLRGEARLCRGRNRGARAGGPAVRPPISPGRPPPRRPPK